MSKFIYGTGCCEKAWYFDSEQKHWSQLHKLSAFPRVLRDRVRFENWMKFMNSMSWRETHWEAISKTLQEIWVARNQGRFYLKVNSRICQTLARAPDQEETKTGWKTSSISRKSIPGYKKNPKPVTLAIPSDAFSRSNERRNLARGED